jgi:hypothetical protein
MGRMLSLQAPLSSSGGMGSGAAPVAAAMGAGSSGGGGDVPLEPFSPYDVPAWAAAPTDAVAGMLAGSAVEDILSPSVIAVGGDVAVAAGPPGWVIGGLIGAATGIFEGLFGGGGSELPPQIRWKLSHRGGDVQEWAQIDGIDPAWAPSWAQTADGTQVKQSTEAPSYGPLQKQGKPKAACEAAAWKSYTKCLKTAQRDMGILALGGGAACGGLAYFTAGAGAVACVNTTLGLTSGFGIRATALCYTKLRSDLAMCGE